MIKILLIFLFLFFGFHINRKAKEIAEENAAKELGYDKKDVGVDNKKSKKTSIRMRQFTLFLVFIGVVIIVGQFAIAILGNKEEPDMYNDESPIDPDLIELIFDEN